MGLTLRNTARRIRRLKGVCVFIPPGYEQMDHQRQTTGFLLLSLHGDVEVDDTWIGGPQPGIRGSRQLKGRTAALVLVAVERRGRRTGRVRIAVISDSRAATYKAFLTAHVAPGATLYTDGLTSFGAEA